MRTFFLFFLLFVSDVVSSQDSVSVLFVGNSYTYVNNLPTVFSNLTLSLGDEATVDSKANGGYTFQMQNNDPLTHTKIKSKPWDYVVLQGQSQEPSFPTSQVNTATLPPAVDLSDSVYANWYCSQAMYFMTWGRQVGDPQWDSINTFDKMNVRLRNAYVRFTDSAQASVAPVGIAWKYVRDNYPTINLYQADGSHPSPEGTYLAACTFYASVFRKSPVGASYTFGLDPTVAANLQTAAAICVLDSLTTWHLRPKEDIAIADFQYSVDGNSVQFINDSWRAISYEWDLGDLTTVLQEDVLHNYLVDGTYTVRLIAISDCGNDTVYKIVKIGSLELTEKSGLDYKLKSLADGNFELTVNLPIQNVHLLDVMGRETDLTQRLVKDSEKSMTLELGDLNEGVYFLQIQSTNNLFTIEIPLFK